MNKLYIVVASGFLLLQSCSTSAEDYAQEWCELNTKIELAQGSEKLLLTEQAKSLEKEIASVYGGDEEKMALIYALTDECD